MKWIKAEANVGRKDKVKNRGKVQCRFNETRRNHVGVGEEAIWVS